MGTWLLLEIFSTYSLELFDAEQKNMSFGIRHTWVPGPCQQTNLMEAYISQVKIGTKTPVFKNLACGMIGIRSLSSYSITWKIFVYISLEITGHFMLCSDICLMHIPFCWYCYKAWHNKSSRFYYQIYEIIPTICIIKKLLSIGIIYTWVTIQ